MYKFEAFNIKSNPHIENYDTNMLTNAPSNNDSTHDGFSIESICRPSISNNNWRISDDNQHIMNFLHLEGIFSRSMVNDKQHISLLQA